MTAIVPEAPSSAEVISADAADEERLLVEPPTLSVYLAIFE